MLELAALTVSDHVSCHEAPRPLLGAHRDRSLLQWLACRSAAPGQSAHLRGARPRDHWHPGPRERRRATVYFCTSAQPASRPATTPSSRIRRLQTRTGSVSTTGDHRPSGSCCAMARPVTVRVSANCESVPSTARPSRRHAPMPSPAAIAVVRLAVEPWRPHAPPRDP
jgi:hypothetical protein